ncbi:pyridoxal-phosphate dependent enzyme [Streptomyces sp. NPDC090022]|uniref:pyridoxal-phosphate dependent enzyme n=1 Tax=Streptomyces sp. NPDC090022 TaxID=3365920 RepID=UPI0038191E6A
MSLVDAVLTKALRTTPLHHLQLAYQGRVQRVGLKLEEHGATGSIKDRTAVGLLRALHEERPLAPGTVVVESTSGNLGLAMANLLAAMDCSFIAVVDLKTPLTTRRTLEASGARVVVVDEPDGQGGYLLSRLRTVRRLCERHPEYRWPDQYANPASPAVHRATTGPELTEQAGPDLSAVYVPVSTGGTFAGVAAHLRTHRPDVTPVAVDLRGSLALGGAAGRRLIPGIGASRPSVFLPAPHTHRSVHVDDVEAMAVCRILAEDLGHELGGSSGCVLAALLADMAQGRLDPGLPVCLAADGGRKYRDTVFSDTWASRHDILTDLTRAMGRLRRDGLRFSIRQYQEHHTP